jgi:hypothetical protein
VDRGQHPAWLLGPRCASLRVMSRRSGGVDGRDGHWRGERTLD